MAASATTSRSLLLFALMAAVLALLIPSYGALHALWVDTDARAYTHGYLVLATCVWLVWRALPLALAQPARPARWLLLPLAGAAALWAVALTAGIQDIDLLMLPVIVWLAVAVAFGLNFARELLVPIGFIVFALPAWSSGNSILQHITVLVNSFLIWLTGMTAIVDGNYVRLAAGVFQIADGCSGLHFFVVGLTIAALYGELGRDPLRRRIEWMVLAAALSMLANWLRVFTIIVAGYLTDMQHYLVRVDHYTFGWVVFAVTMAIFFWIANRRAAKLQAAPVSSPAASVLPLSRNAVAAGMAVLVAAAFVLPGWHAVAPVADRAVDISWPALPGGSTAGGSSGWTPVYEGASATSMQSYHMPSGATVEMYQAVYASQRQGAELVGIHSSLFGAEEVDLMTESTVEAGGPWREWHVVSRGRKSLVRARWEVAGRGFARPLQSQLWYGLTRLFAPVTSRVVALRTQCSESCAAAQTALDEIGKLLPIQPVSARPDTGTDR